MPEMQSDTAFDTNSLTPYPDNVSPLDFNIRAICAVDAKGRLGADGRLIYHSAKDMAFFRKTTSPGVLIFGHISHAEFMEAIEKLNVPITVSRDTFFGSPVTYMRSSGRMILRDNKNVPLHDYLQGIRDTLQIAFQELPIWICGGAKTYTRYQAVTKVTVVSHIHRYSDVTASAAFTAHLASEQPFKNETFMPPLWNDILQRERDQLG